MPVCSKCGTWNQDAATKCDKCGATLTAESAAPVRTGVAQVGSSGASKGGFAEWRRKQAVVLTAVLVIAMVAGVLLVRSAITKYDATGQGTLNSNYSVETKTKNGVTESVQYVVTYTFAVQGVEYTGKDKIDNEPTVADVPARSLASFRHEVASAASSSAARRSTNGREPRSAR